MKELIRFLDASFSRLALIENNSAGIYAVQNGTTAPDTPTIDHIQYGLAAPMDHLLREYESRISIAE